MITASIPEQLLTPEQAANYLNLSVDALQGWRCKTPGRAGGPPFIKISGITVRYRRSEIEAWLNDRTITPVTDR
jgi:predicted DNA-binding transcriptional regulator AlpA